MLSLLLSISTSLASQNLQLTADDGVQIQAKVWRARGERGVILVHDKDQTSETWTSVSEALSQRGLTIISVDLRGHGASSDVAQLDGDAYQAMSKDILAAGKWMDHHGIEQITCVGAGLGANLCLQDAAMSVRIERLALLSPGFNYEGVTSISAASELGQRPMLVVFSDDDTYALQTSMVLADKLAGKVQLEARSGLGHGTRMLSREPDLETLLVEWILTTDPPPAE
jgi:pimeloyl-ACP methyl ester carboxylesterase